MYDSMIEQGSSKCTEYSAYTQTWNTIYINFIYKLPLPNKGFREIILFIMLSFAILFTTSFCAWNKNLAFW